MSYAVKEIYYTLQGEGVHAGRPAVFLRFSGCNLWSGLERDRDSGPGGCSAWCDTDFVGTDGPRGARYETAVELAREVQSLWPSALSSGVSSDVTRQVTGRFVVCTGGEPLLQLDEQLVDALHDEDFEVAIETNGTLEPPRGVDWICVSPKAGSDLKLNRGDELKLVYPQEGASPERYEALDFDHFLLQPLDGPDAQAHTRASVEYCLTHRGGGSASRRTRCSRSPEAEHADASQAGG